MLLTPGIDYELNVVQLLTNFITFLFYFFHFKYREAIMKFEKMYLFFQFNIIL